MKPTVRFFGPIGNHTGYGNAVKNFALAFSKSGIKTKFQFNTETRNKFKDFLSELEMYSGETDIDFYLHGPPWTRHKSKAKYKIAYFYWETDRLPVSWIRGINAVDEIWAPCRLVKDACLKAKFRGKIRVIPTPADHWGHDKKIVIPSEDSKDFFVSDDVFKFYSIFQWHERKGYKELLSSYYKTFGEDDNVILVLKVNALNYAGQTREKMKQDLLKIKRKMNLSYYPPIYFSDRILPTETIQAIHNTCDCYVSPFHGEGWGMPIHDAMISGNNIITTQFGGVSEFLNNKSALILKHQMGPVSNMEWSPLYSRNQNWAYPSISNLCRLMRSVYENPEAYSGRKAHAKKVADNMTTDRVAKMINTEISRIVNG